MKISKRQIYFLLFPVLCIISITVIWVSIEKYKKAENELCNKINPILDYSIAEYTHYRLLGEKHSQSTYGRKSKSYHEYLETLIEKSTSPKPLSYPDTIANRDTTNKNLRRITVATGDTIIVRYVERSNDIFDYLRGGQSALNVANYINLDSIHLLFKQQLLKHDLDTLTEISINTTLHNIWQKSTGDTLKFKYVTPTLYHGHLHELEYKCHFTLTFSTIIKHMEMTEVVALFIALLIFIFLAIYTETFYYNNSEGLIKKRSGNVFWLGNTKLNLEKGTLYGPDGNKLIKGNNLALLEMLIKSPYYSLDKQLILKTLWNNSHYGNPNTNMTSAVNRLNNILKEIGCNYNIVTNEEKEYCLELRDHKPGIFELVVNQFFAKQKYILASIKNIFSTPKPQENGQEEKPEPIKEDPAQEEPRENIESED